jgi:polysaccharide biosynthesis protein PslH
MNILMLCSTFPYPPTEGRKQLRTFHFLQHLVKNHQVTLLTQPTDRVTEEEIQILQEIVTELVIFPVSSSSQLLNLMGKAKHLGTFVQQGTPRSVLKTYSAPIALWVKEAVGCGNFQAIAIEDTSDEIYIDPQWQKEIATVLNLQFSEYGRYKQQLETGDFDNEIKERINLGLCKRYEQNYLEKFKAIVTVTEKDRRIVRELAPESQIIAIPNGVDLTKFPRRVTNQGGQRIVFVGNMDRPSNVDAARFLTLEIFAEIRQRYPEAALEIVGANPVAEVLELAAIAGVTVTGRVKNVVEYLHWATVCVISIRKGFGLKNRTLEAMAAGVPVVASDRALAGLKIDGANVPLRAMRANKLEEYIYAIGRLFSEPKLREKLSENGRLLVKNEYTWERVGQKYERVLIDASGSISAIN